MAADRLSRVRAFVREVAAERHPGARLFALAVTDDGPEAGVRTGDLVVYAQADPRPGQAVVWTAGDGQSVVGRLQADGRVRSRSASLRPDKVRGVVVAAITRI